MTTIVTTCPNWCTDHITGMAQYDPDYHRSQERTFATCEKNGWDVAASLASYESDDLKEPTHIELTIGDLLHGTVGSISCDEALNLAHHLVDLVDQAWRAAHSHLDPVAPSQAPGRELMLEAGVAK